VTKKALLILAMTMTLPAGCFNSHSVTRTSAGNLPRTDTESQMVAYLQQQSLPALQSAQIWNNDYGPGLKVLTRHYELYTTLLDPLMLRRLPGFLESAHREYNRQFPTPIETESRFTLYLFADRAQWEDFSSKFAGPLAPIYRKIEAGAYYLNGACVVYNIGREKTFAVLGHEGWHQFNHRHFKFRLPSWLDEGIAMLFESYHYDRGLFYFEPGRNLQRLGGLKRTLAGNNMIPLKDLIAMNPGQVLIGSTAEDVSAFYSQSYALVRFLREEGYGKRLGNYQRLLLDGLNGNWPLSEPAKRFAADRNIPLTARWNSVVSPMLFEHYVGGDFEKLGQEYLAFCRKIVYHVHFK